MSMYEGSGSGIYVAPLTGSCHFSTMCSSGCLLCTDGVGYIISRLLPESNLEDAVTNVHGQTGRNLN